MDLSVSKATGLDAREASDVTAGVGGGPSASSFSLATSPCPSGVWLEKPARVTSPLVLWYHESSFKACRQMCPLLGDGVRQGCSRFLGFTSHGRL